MAAQGKHKDALVRTAAELFRKQGYAATGLNEIIAVSGAPKGSLYHYFPQGKVEIGAAAVRLAGVVGEATLQSLAEAYPDAEDFILAYGTRLAERLEGSDFREGCPIATTLLELAPAELEITAAGRDALFSWAEVISRLLASLGCEPLRASRFGSFAVSAIEGALLQARVQKSADPIKYACAELATVFRAACRP